MKNEDLLSTRLIEIDCMLTEKDRERAIHTAKQGVEDFLEGREYYLSDGGYSRLVFREPDRIFVTGNSTEKVKRKFAKKESLIKELLLPLIQKLLEFEQ